MNFGFLAALILIARLAIFVSSVFSGLLGNPEVLV
jgi:hypothetical protein